MTSGCFYAEKKGTSLDSVAPASFVYVRGPTVTSEDKAVGATAGTSGVSYYLTKDFADTHNEKLSSTWRATYDSPFIQQHRTVLSSLIKDFGFSKVNSIGRILVAPIRRHCSRQSLLRRLPHLRSRSQENLALL